MTGKNSGKHGIFEFLEYAHDPLHGRVNSSRAIQSELVWEVAGRHGKSTVAGGVPMSYPARKAPGFYLGDFLSPADAPDFASDPAIFAELEKAVGPYRALVDDGPRRRERGGGPGRPDRLPRPPPQGRPVPHEAVPLGPLHVRPDGDRPDPARALARLGALPPRGQGARPLRDPRGLCRLLEEARRRGVGEIEAGPASGHDAPPDQRPRLRADRVVRQLQRLAPGAGRHRPPGLVLRQAEEVVLRPRGDARVVL